MRAVAILLFDGIEPLDAIGPLEVFSVAARMSVRADPQRKHAFEVFTVGEAPVCRSRYGLEVCSQHRCVERPSMDVLLVPGGIVSTECENPRLIEWIARAAAGCEIVASVCTGAFLLGRAGLLDGRRATTHWEDLDDLRNAYPAAHVIDQVRWTEDGKLWTSAGISAGIDMSLALVAQLAGTELARLTARQMDYRWP